MRKCRATESTLLPTETMKPPSVCSIATLALKQYRKVKAALLHVIIAQKKISNVHRSIKEERQEFPQLYTVFAQAFLT